VGIHKTKTLCGFREHHQIIRHPHDMDFMGTTINPNCVDFAGPTKPLNIQMIWVIWAPPSHKKPKLCGYLPQQVIILGKRKKKKKEIWMLTNASLQGTMICP
jgi:hypothetical protein